MIEKNWVRPQKEKEGSLMQKSFYQSKFEEMFPKIESVIQGDFLAILQVANSTGLQERYVAKSNKLAELNQEMELVAQLKEKSDMLWDKICKNVTDNGEYRYKDPKQDPNLPHIGCQPLVYSKYREDRIWEQILAIAAQNEELTNYPRYWELARQISCNIDSFYERICIAVDQESSGTTGEDTVAEYIKRVSTSKVLQNVVLPAALGNGTKTAESDLVIVTANGIYVCEIKNYGKAGQTLQIDRDGKFAKLDSRGNWLKDYMSPFEQNNYHCRAIYQVLQERGFSNVPIHPVVVVSNTDVNIQNNSGMLVVDPYQLGDVIRRAEQANVLTLQQMSDVYNAIKEKRIEERSFPVFSVPFDMYDFCLSALLQYAQEYEKWASDCSKSLTQWATKCNKLWKEMNQDAVKREETLTHRKKTIATIVRCLVVVLSVWLILWAICTFWEQILAAIGFILLIGFFWLIVKCFS